MASPDPRILTTFPYPVASPYALVFAEGEVPSKRRWALCFTVYQLLRMVGLPLLSQYLREPVDSSARSSITALNRAIMALRSPHFSDWMSLIGALRRYLPQVGVTPFFAQLDTAFETLTEVKRQPFGINGKFDLPPLEAVWALRNGTAHGGVPDEAVAATHVDHYLPELQRILSAFAWIGEYRLLTCRKNTTTAPDCPFQVQVLHGVTPSAVAPNRLPSAWLDALQESPAILVAPDGRVLLLFPFFNPLVSLEPVCLYDGHVAIQVENVQNSERSAINYLGVYQSVSDAQSVEDLRALFAARQISFLLKKEQTAPWTIADSAGEYSRSTVSDLIGTKYLPACYVPFVDVELHFQRFLTIPELSQWPADVSRARYVNGLILTGPAGAGKTAFLARQVAALLADPVGAGEHESPNLVLFLRGDSITERPQGMSLFQEVVERLGIAVEGALQQKAKGKRTARGFSSFRELFAHLHGQWKNDRVPGRRFILVLDALNESPYAELIVRQALALIREAARYPWLKVVLSLRQEWLALLEGKLGAQEQSPIEDLRPFLYVIDSTPEGTCARFPTVALEPLSEEQARLVYEGYQKHAQRAEPREETASTPACLTWWSDIPVETRLLLRNPLYLHLFSEACDGRQADPMVTTTTILQRYVERTLRKKPGLRAAIAAVVTHLLRDEARSSANLSDADAHAIYRTWSSALPPTEARLSLSPIEALVHEGLMRKRVRGDGGGYRFIFQTVAEYLLYRDLAENCSPTEDALSYWTRGARAAIFPEYTGAFGFLLRDWAEQGKYAEISQLVEAAPEWLRQVLITLLVEWAQRSHDGNTNNPHVKAAVDGLTASGGERCIEAFLNAGIQLTRTRFIPTARTYLEAGIALAERLSVTNQENGSLTYLFAVGSHWLGGQLASTGHGAEADMLSHRAVTLLESLCLRHPRNLTFGLAFARAWEDRAALLSMIGRLTEAEHAYREAIGLYQALHSVVSEPMMIDKHLGWVLSRCGVVLENLGRPAEAEQLHRQAIAILAPLWKMSPSDSEIGSAVSSAMSNLGTVLELTKRWAEAEEVYQRAVLILEAVRSTHPHRFDFAHLLAGVLLNLGGVLADTGRGNAAEQVYRRTIALCEELRREHATDRAMGLIFGKVLMNLGLLSTSRADSREAEQYYLYAVQVFRALWETDQQDIESGQGLADTWANFGKLLWETGRLAEAVQTTRESVDLYQKLWRASPMAVALADAWDAALQNLLLGLFTTGQKHEAGEVARQIFALRRDRWKANPDDNELTVRYAEALCHSEQFADASRLLDRVLARVPDHPEASRLRQHIAKQYLA